MSVDAEQIRGKMIEVLLSREALSIDFTAFNTRIHGLIFPIIAADLTGIFNFRLSPTRFVETADLPRPAKGGYSNKTNTFYFRETVYLGSREWQTTVIHESVHAWTDRIQAKGIGVFENEALAFIAAHVYSRKVGLSLSRFKNPIHPFARSVANTIIDGNKPTSDSLSRLIRQISITPNYANRAKEPIVFDG